MSKDFFDDDDLDEYQPNRQTMARAAAVILLLLFAGFMLGGLILTLVQ